MNPTLNISSGPHVRDGWSTRFIMLMVCLALLPATVIGCLVNGWKAVFVILVSVGTAVVSELLFDLVTKRPKTWLDGSALVTGLLLALSLSADVPLYIPAIGSAFAIIVVKCCFGGLGKNFINPALAARCVLLLSFSNSMTKFTVDGVTSATPIAELAAGRAVNITSMFLGTAPGVIGSSIVALLIGGLFLWALDIIHGQIWISVIVGFVLIIGIFGGQGFDPKFIAAHLCGGGVILGAFFMATDYATSPVSRLGHTVYGILIGVLGALFRVFGTAADSFSYSIIIANLFVPLIDRYIISKPFAYRKSSVRVQNGETVPPLWKRIPRPVIVVTAIALMAGLALSGVYMLTKENIAKQKEAAELQAYKEVLPQAETIEKISIDPGISKNVYGSKFGRTYINEMVAGKDASGKTVGHAISVTNAEGYSGNVTLTVGIDAEGKITSIKFTELKETPGKGMLCDEPAFKDQFAGRAESAFVLNGTGEDKIDGISGATITSKSVVNAVNAALDFYRSVTEGE